MAFRFWPTRLASLVPTQSKGVSILRLALAEVLCVEDCMGCKSSTVEKSGFLRCVFLMSREASPDQSFSYTAGLTALLCFVSNNMQNCAASYWRLWQDFYLFFWISCFKLHPNLLVRLFKKLLEIPSEFTGTAQGKWPLQYTHGLRNFYGNSFKIHINCRLYAWSWQPVKALAKGKWVLCATDFFSGRFCIFPPPNCSIKRTPCYRS